jgi:short-subunit dehydrogenase
MQNFNTDRQRIWLVGASSGIGLLLAERLLQEGHQLILSARRTKSMQALQQSYPDHCRLLPLDITDSQAVKASAEKLPLFFAGIDTVIINAGVCEYVDIQAFDSALFQRVMDVNFLGACRCLEIALPLLKNTPGHIKPYIVGVGSLADRAPFPRAQAYGASKSALRYMLECMHIELQAQNIDVSIVEPGFVATPLTAGNDFPMPFMLSSRQAVEAILKGMKKRKAVISFPKRLAWPLIIANTFKPLWRHWVGPLLVKNEVSRETTQVLKTSGDKK